MIRAHSGAAPLTNHLHYPQTAHASPLLHLLWRHHTKAPFLRPSPGTLMDHGHAEGSVYLVYYSLSHPLPLCCCPIQAQFLRRSTVSNCVTTIKPSTPGLLMEAPIADGSQAGKEVYLL